MTHEMAAILPIPQHSTAGGGTFHVSDSTMILLPPESGPQALGAAQSLAAEIATVTGLQVQIVKVAQPPRLSDIIVLYDDRQAAADWLGQPLPLDTLEGHGEEAYSVSITPERVLAGGPSGGALHHAAQTLRQIARLQGSAWQAGQIDDWPVLAYRGVMLDVSRGKVPTLETLREVVDCLALYKMNVLQLYTEHTFDFPSHPRIGLGTDPLTSADMLALDAYARERHVELMPNLNCFGHCAHLLSLPEYSHLAETSVPWTLTPVDVGTYDLLGDLLDDMLPSFSSAMFNAGCDETWDLGKGRSAALAAEIGVGRVYLQHLQHLHDMAQMRGRRIQFWGDILLHHPELVPDLPEDVTLLDWHYEAQDTYPSLDVFSQSGRPFWVCPGTSSWNTLFPRIENANGNIRTLVREGAERGAEGMLNTDWGDHGHYQPLGLSWYGYVYGAAQAWSGGTTSDTDFDARFGTLWFGAAGPDIVSAIRALGRLNTLPGMARPNTSNSIMMLLDEPLAGELIEAVPAATLREIIMTAAEVESRLRSAWPMSRDRLTLEEIIHSARMMAHAAHKLRTSQLLRLALAGSGALPEAARAAREALRELDVALVPLEGEFVRLWRERARESEIEITRQHLDALRERYAMAQAWLEDIERGEHDGLDIEAYLAAHPRYEILGQRFWRQMRAIEGMA